MINIIRHFETTYKISAIIQLLQSFQQETILIELTNRFCGKNLLNRGFMVIFTTKLKCKEIMIIKSAKFVISNTDIKKCPSDNKPEYAFIGRSNVGKSSLINMLTGRKNLAMTSSTPGKTMLINHFLINDAWYLVDLPGYGFAQRGKESRKQLQKIIESYILQREQMVCLMVLVDCRHKPQKIDLEFMRWLGENGIPFSIVFTKLDKLSSTAAKKSIEIYTATLLEEWEELPIIFKSSSVDSRGRNDILDYIDNLNNLTR